ncbi:ATP phosphoribosyltransferase [Dactylosporangium sp. NPDC051541]|uniref:ATP phosphoribosyltransferase n=1 Tax=Dactylosporangium sp. NPDC051541 TaxID=3363977 RepID=UPI0037B518D2
MLRIAVPNKGVLALPASQMLQEAGYRQRSDPKDLLCLDEANSVEFFYLRPRDIATYVGSGDLDLGITGRDLLVDAGSPAVEVLDLNFGRATIRFAAVPGSLKGTAPADLEGLRVATAFPGVMERYFAEHGVRAAIIRLDGAVENAIRLGVADVVADVVETGKTLRQAGLDVLGDPIMKSSALLIRRAGDDIPAGVPQLLRRLQGVLVARQYVMLAYDVQQDGLDAAVALTPGIESPTISKLHREGWFAVQAMVPQAEVHRIMDELYEIGARAILVTGIHACRL